MLDAVIAAHRDGAEFDVLLNARCWARAVANIDLDDALADCNRAIRAGASPDRLDSRGLVYFLQAKYPLAIGDYNAALKLDPNMAWSLYMRGLTKIAMGESESGKADQAAARAIQPDIGDVVAGYGIGLASTTSPKPAPQSQ
jgi:tetratricopeptide (TPR) repeat protein